MNTQNSPQEELYFRPLRDFADEVAGRRSSYLAGFVYTIRPYNRELLKKAEEWRRGGLIEFVPRPLARVDSKARVY